LNRKRPISIFDNQNSQNNDFPPYSAYINPLFLSILRYLPTARRLRYSLALYRNKPQQTGGYCSMAQKMYVGNLPYRTTENDLRALFNKYEPIHSVVLIADKATDHPRGYGFIELDEPKAAIALSDLKDTTYNGRLLKISKATGPDPRQKALKKNAERKILAAHFRKMAKRCNTVTEYAIIEANNYG
jgi:hypothetical protein